MHRTYTVGLISDTHGLLRPEAVEALRGSDFIIHAGDIGSEEVLQQLAALAPLTAVRGNTDGGGWIKQVPLTAELQVGKVLVHVLHDLAWLDPAVRTRGVRVVVSGHSHKPAAVERDAVLYVNPGSAGRRRFKLPVSVGRLTVQGDNVRAETVLLL